MSQLIERALKVLIRTSGACIIKNYGHVNYEFVVTDINS